MASRMPTAAARPGAAFRYDVFISYAPADAAWVFDWLLPRLEAAGVVACVDARCFDPGAPVVAETERAIRESRHILAVMTPEWVTNESSNFEELLVQHEDPGARWRRLIPLLLKPCTPPERIQILQWVDFSQAEQQEQQLGRVVAAVEGRQALPELRVDLFPEPARRRFDLRMSVIAAVLAFLTLVAVASTYYLQHRRPAYMPAGSFNIAVADFPAVAADGSPTNNPQARERARGIASYVAAQAGTISQAISRTVIVWGPDQGVGAVQAAGGTNPSQGGVAAQRAATLHADVLVYGRLKQVRDNQWQLEPELYLSQDALKRAEELAGEQAFGAPIAYRADQQASPTLLNAAMESRLKALARIIIGLSFFSFDSLDGYQQAASFFGAAAQDPAWGASSRPQGQEILYLFLGNAYLGQAPFLDSQPTARAGAIAQARAAYEHALTLNLNYARTHNGLAAADYEAARPAAPVQDQCAWGWDDLTHAEQERQSALAAPAASKPAAGDVDLRAHVGLGQIYYIRGLCQDPSAWNDARREYQTALELYDAQPKDYLRAAVLVVSADLGNMALLRSEAPTEAAAQAAASQPAAPVTPMPQTAAGWRHEAIQYLGQAIDLAGKLEQSDNLIRTADFMPSLLTAYCLDGQSAQAREALARFQPVAGDAQQARQAILDAIPAETRQGCLP
jgi:hypothetical protein